MKNLFLLLIFTFPIYLFGQSVGINIDGTSPHPSAQLDIKSTTKGVLIPRLVQFQINAISNPADGLIVYNRTSDRFQHYSTDDHTWNPIANMKDLYELTDADEDTKIIVEENPDEDKIKLYAEGNLMIEMKKDTMFIPQGVFSGYGTTNPLDPIHVKAEDERKSKYKS